MSLAIGKPNAGGGGGKKRNFDRLKQGTAIYRVLPALGKLADKGVWSVWHEIIFGYKTTEGYMRPFESCQETTGRGDKRMVTVRDAARDKIEKNKENIEAFKELLKKSPGNAQIAKKLKEAEEYDDQYNVDKAHYVNALNAAGEVTLLRIGYKEMLSFKAAREKLQASDGVDCVDVDGCYMEFSKTGTGRDTVCQVTPAYEKVNGALHLKTHSIDEAELKKIANGYFELDDVYARPTAEEVEQMANAGANEATVVETIMDRYRTAYTKEQPKQSAATTAASKPKPKLDAASLAKAADPVDESPADEAPEQEQQAPAQPAKPAAKSSPVAAKPAAPAAAPVDPNGNLTPEEIQFMKENGIEL